ncbi:hypothetical protein [Acinetobacter baumannii]
MADEIVTREQLVNASLDADSLEVFISGSDMEDVLTRLGKQYPTLAKLVRILMETGGWKAYQTEAALLATTPTVNPSVGYAFDTKKMYLWNGTSWTDEGLSQLDQARLYTNTATDMNVQRQGFITQSRNLFDAATCKLGYILDENGNEVVNSSSAISDFIPVQPSVKYTISSISGQRAFISVGYFTADKVFIRRDATINDPNPLTITIPANARYVRFNINTSAGAPSAHNRMFNKGSVALPYEAYYIRISDRVTLPDIPIDTSKLKSNIFGQTSFENVNANLYEGTVAVESGVAVLSMQIKSTTWSGVFYDYPVSNFLRIGDTISFSADSFVDALGVNASSDLSIAFLDAAGAAIGTPTFSYPTKNGEWERRSVTSIIPENTKTVRLRFIRRAGTSTVAKFKKPVFESSSWYTSLPNFHSATQSTSSSTASLFVAKTGNDNNDGVNAPLLTIQAAINKLKSTGGTVIIKDSEWYRETVNIDSPHKIRIASQFGHRAKIVGSDRLVVTKTTGMTKVYQAPLATKPKGVGDGLGYWGQAMIAEWGTPYRPITKFHALQRGYSHFLPYTPMFEATSKAELDTSEGNGKWFWEGGIIYFAATDGGDATLKQYEARVRKTFTHSVGEIECHAVDFMFCSDDAGFTSTGMSIKRTSCLAIGNYGTGFADYANSTVAHQDISLNNGIDGISAQSNNYVGKENLQAATSAVYYDPWSALNYDDGVSFHRRGTCTVYGGLIEQNVKGGVIHASGGGGTCYNTICRDGHTYGFSAGGVATDGRVKSTLICISTISDNNTNNYHAGSGDAETHCYNTLGINPTNTSYLGELGKVYLYDAKHVGDPAKAKSGANVFIQNSSVVT